MLNWLFKTRSGERKEVVRSAADLPRDRRNIGLWNDPIPEYSHTAPNPMIRNRVRYLVANSAVAARAVQAFVDNLVGPGITLLPKIASPELKSMLLDTWNAWTDVADIDGLVNFYGLQALAARMMFIDGEIFVRFTTDTEGSLRLQLLPAEFIDTTTTRDNVLAGVEFDSAGRRIAFYIYEWHPGNLLRLPKINRVPSTEVLQIFRPTIPGQVRGVSALLPIMTKLNDLDQFDRATLVKQKTGALLTGFITTPNDNPLGAAKADDGTWTASLEPGTIQRLSPGESLEFSDPPETAGYSDFAKTQLRLIASGLGLPYNILSGDLSDTSYSSARVGLIEFRKYIDALQWQFVHMFCRPVFQRWVELEVLRGALPLTENGVRQYIRSISWAPPAMQMTDPQREVDAMVRAIRAGLMSREMAVASLGYDLAEVDAQIAAGNAAADAVGIVLDSDPRRVTQQGNPTVILGNS
ncbi:MAG: phage portal protein [Candidatus Solibacter sp.]|nr:phage portal protein [Candidatus Solibacter sp.]